MKVKVSAFIERLKKHVGDGYVYGGTGVICTVSLLRARWAQYGKPGQAMGPGYYELNGDFTKGKCARWLGKWVADCSNLMCAIYREMGGSTGSSSANGFYSRCSKRGGIVTMPKQPGTFVFITNGSKMTHIGMYIGGGEVIESRGVSYGVVRGKMDKRWTHWGQFPAWLEFDLPVDGTVPQKPAPVEAGKPHKVMVTASALNVRTGPGTAYKSIALVRKDAILSATGNEVGGWLEIDRAGVKVWVSGKYVVEYKEPAAPAVKAGVVNCGSLNVRAGAGTGHKVLKTIHRGDKVQVLEQKGNWLRIGAGQWVSAPYIKLV